MISSHGETGVAGAAQALPVSRVARERLGAYLTTTPGRMRLIAAAIIAGAIVLGLLAWGAERKRVDAAHAVATQTELLLQSVQLYASLSDAEATVSTTFLTGSLEPAARRQRYLSDLSEATGALASLTSEVGGSAIDRGAVETITAQLPIYAGYVESARAHNIEGQPVGAPYLRSASTLLSDKILPAADRLYTAAAQRLGVDYTSGTTAGALVAFVIAGILLLAGLILTQIYLSAISKRTFNVPLVAGTCVLLVLAVWAMTGMLGEQSALARAQRDGSDPVELLSAMQILTSRAQSDDSLALVAHGGDTQHPADATAVIRALAGPGGLLRASIGRIGQQTEEQLAPVFAAYGAQNAQIVNLLRQGEVTTAIDLEVGSAKTSASPSDLLRADLSNDSAKAQSRFVSAADDATSSLRGLSIAIPVLIAAAAVLALLGLRQRIRDYL
jgi:hypothetical protein